MAKPRKDPAEVRSESINVKLNAREKKMVADLQQLFQTGWEQTTNEPLSDGEAVRRSIYLAYSWLTVRKIPNSDKEVEKCLTSN